MDARRSQPVHFLDRVMNGMKLPKKWYGVEETVRGVEQEIGSNNSFDKLNQQGLRSDGDTYLLRHQMGENDPRNEDYKHDANRDERAIHESVDQVQPPLLAQDSLLFAESE